MARAGSRDGLLGSLLEDNNNNKIENDAGMVTPRQPLGHERRPGQQWMLASRESVLMGNQNGWRSCRKLQPGRLMDSQGEPPKRLHSRMDTRRTACWVKPAHSSAVVWYPLKPLPPKKPPPRPPQQQSKKWWGVGKSLSESTGPRGDTADGGQRHGPKTCPSARPAVTFVMADE